MHPNYAIFEMRVPKSVFQQLLHTLNPKKNIKTNNYTRNFIALPQFTKPLNYRRKILDCAIDACNANFLLDFLDGLI